MPNKEQAFVQAVDNLLMNMDNLAASVADRPVGLADADAFNVKIDTVLSREDIKASRRALANAISAEKWREGAEAAIALLRMLGVFL